MRRQLLEMAPHDRETITVLYLLPDNSYTPYVTWLARADSPEDTFWGHYFGTLEDAQEDFDKRSGAEERMRDMKYGIGGIKALLEEDEG